MKKILLYLIASSISGLVGYRVGYEVAKKHFENLADREVESVREALIENFKSGKFKYDPNSPKSEPNIEPTPEADLEKGTAGAPPVEMSRTNDIDYSSPYRKDTAPERIPGNPGGNFVKLKREENDTSKPYIISAEDFRDSEYECITLFLSSDKVLLDDDYNLLSNIGIVGGHSILSQLGQDGDDCLYVQDDGNGIVYEIILEERTYEKIRGAVYLED